MSYFTQKAIEYPVPTYMTIDEIIDQYHCHDGNFFMLPPDQNGNVMIYCSGLTSINTDSPCYDDHWIDCYLTLKGKLEIIRVEKDLSSGEDDEASTFPFCEEFEPIFFFCKDPDLPNDCYIVGDMEDRVIVKCNGFYITEYERATHQKMLASIKNNISKNNTQFD